MMADVFLAELAISDPRYHLGVGSGPHGQQARRMLGAIEEVILKGDPTSVMVYGDTNSTLTPSLAAVKIHAPIAHV